MGRARFDANNIHTLTGVSSSDSSTPIELWADPSTHALIVSGTFAVTKTPLTGASPAAATVGVASAQVVAVNTNRKGLVLVNTSTNTISLGFGTAAVLNSGITLNASGGTLVMDEYTFSTQAVNAIASGVSSNLAVQEFN